MEGKTIILITTAIGGFIGGYIPTLWDASPLSLSSVFLSALGGVIGIYIGYQMTN